MSSQSQQQIGAVGIDFGSLRSVIGVAKKKGVDVITNQASSRETANIVGFGEKERYLGEQGAARAKSNFKNTCSFSSRLLGMNPDYPQLKEETKWITSKFTTSEDGKLVYDVLNQGERAQFTPIQVTAAMLGEVRKIVALNDIANKEAVISVPSYFTEQEKKALLDAARIADLKVARLLTESSAITLSYGLFRKKDLPEKDKEARNVAFIDFGHSKFSAFVSSFNQEKCKVLLQVNERHLGSRDFDWTLLKHYDQLFQKQTNGLSILENKKAILRALDAIQKQRKILSANLHAAISAECLVEDEDLNYDMTREEFETLIAPDLERIKAALLNLKAQITEQKINIHSVEIVGCAVRTPAVQQLITEILGFEIQRTLNQSECIARGCAMMAAYLSPQFRVAEYQLEECNNYPINIQWNFLNRGEMVEEGKTTIFFDKGCTIPNIKSLKFNRNDGIQLNFSYKDGVEGFNSQIASFKIGAFEHKEDDYSLKIRAKLNINGIVELTESAMIENYKVEEKVRKPKKDEKDDKEEEQFEIKMKDKTRTTQLDNEVSNFYALEQAEVDKQFNKEFEMITHDRVILETNAKKNELETYIYDSRDKISSSCKQYIDPTVIPALEELQNKSSTWLENEGFDSSKGQYVAKIEELQKILEPVYRRQKQYSELPSVYTQLDQVILSAQQFVNNTDEKFAHITAEDRQPIIDEIAKIQKQVSEAQAKQQNTKLFEEPALTIEELNNLGNTLMNLARPIMAKQAPKKEEPKAEEAPAAEQTGEQQKTEEKTESNTEGEKKAEKMEEE